MKIVGLALALACSIAPAFALEEENGMTLNHEDQDHSMLELPEPAGLKPEIKEPPLPVMIVPTPEEAKVYSEEHPLVVKPFQVTGKVITKIGKITKLNKVGRVLKKTGCAASDAFVAFGKKTEKFHPGLQTVGYFGQIATPFLVPIRR